MKLGVDAEMEGDSSGGQQQQEEHHQPKRLAEFARRAGSSWHRGNSAWKFPGRESQRARSPVGRRVPASEVPAVAEVAEEGIDRLPGVRTVETNEVTVSESTSYDPRVELQVNKEQNYFRVKGSVETVVDPDTLYGIITDYNSNARVFRNVDRVEVEERGGEKVVTQFLHWNFLMWSGNYDIKMKVKDCPDTRSISYELAQPGFLKIFNGSWSVEPVASEGASKLVLNQKALPSYFPPGPFSVGAGSYAQKILTNQVTSILTDVATEASQVKRNSFSSS